MHARRSFLDRALFAIWQLQMHHVCRVVTFSSAKCVHATITSLTVLHCTQISHVLRAGNLSSPSRKCWELFDMRVLAILRQFSIGQRCTWTSCTRSAVTRCS